MPVYMMVCIIIFSVTTEDSHVYRYNVSERVGRSSQKEQYAFIYRCMYLIHSPQLNYCHPFLIGSNQWKSLMYTNILMWMIGLHDHHTQCCWGVYWTSVEVSNDMIIRLSMKLSECIILPTYSSKHSYARPAWVLHPCFTHKTIGSCCWDWCTPCSIQWYCKTFPDDYWYDNGWSECWLLLRLKDCIQNVAIGYQYKLHLVDWEWQWHHHWYLWLCIWQVC